MDASFGSKDNLLSFTQSSPSDHGRAVLKLVFQAAEVFSGMEEQVRETEARAQSMRKSAEERVRLAEKRVEEAERVRREIVDDVGRKLQEASKALTNAQARIRAAEDQVTAFEFRAQSAEANLHDAKQALLQVEEAIRERLLSHKQSSVEAQHDLASPSLNG
jgi:chromosome segregation ATPase